VTAYQKLAGALTAAAIAIACVALVETNAFLNADNPDKVCPR
jgi:hypothetical protein